MATSKLYGEREIVQRLAAGDEEAFTAIFDHYRGKVYHVALGFLKSSMQAEEIVQDVFLKIWLKRSELPAVRQFDAYLFILARNIILDRLKKKAYEAAAMQQLSSGPAYTADTDHLVRQHQYESLLEKAVSRLPPAQKSIFILAKTEGLRHEDIARQLKISQLTVKKQMSRALKTIRQYLNKNMEPWIFLPLLLLLAC